MWTMLNCKRKIMGCSSTQVIESSGWLGILVSGILVEKGKACLVVADALVAVPCQSTVNKGEMKT